MSDVQLDEENWSSAKGRSKLSVRAKAGEIEGYLAGVLALAWFLLPSVDHPSNLEVVWGAVHFAITYGCALGGARFGRTGGRIAGWIILVVLGTALVANVIVLGIVRWQDVRWYWQF